MSALCRLRPKGALQLGDGGGAPERTPPHIPSDTLFSAACSAWRLLFGKASLTKLLKEFLKGKPPFTISSAFPWAGSELYFPAPRRLAKSGRWLPKARFEEALAGRLKPLNDSPGTQPPSDGGCFFLADFASDKVRADFEAAIRLLADEGIGGRRSVGRGLFHPPAWEEAAIASPGAFADARCLLSMFYPKDDAEAGRLAKGWYRLKERGGFICSQDGGRGLRRRPVRLAEEGASAQGAAGLAGALVDVTPDAFKAHRVFRSGLAYSVPCVSYSQTEAAA